MLLQKEFLHKIKDDFRLNIYEAKVWSALLSRGIATAGELADISGVPRSRCYDVLEGLEKKGFIIMKLGKPIRYIAVQPEEIVDRVKKDINQNRDRSLDLFESLKDTDVFKELELLHKAGIEKINADELTNVITGRNNIYYTMKNMLENTKKKAVLVTTENGFVRKANALKSILARLNRNGVKVKFAAPINDKIAKKTGIANLKNIELKNTNASARFLVVDGKELLFMISDDNVDKDYDTAVWVESDFFVRSMEKLFLNNV